MTMSVQLLLKTTTSTKEQHQELHTVSQKSWQDTKTKFRLPFCQLPSIFHVLPHPNFTKSPLPKKPMTPLVMLPGKKMYAIKGEVVFLDFERP